MSLRIIIEFVLFKCKIMLANSILATIYLFGRDEGSVKIMFSLLKSPLNC